MAMKCLLERKVSLLKWAPVIMIFFYLFHRGAIIILFNNTMEVYIIN